MSGLPSPRPARSRIVAIVINYRKPGMTHDCLASLAGQGLDRVLLIDNSADDGTCAHQLRELIAPASLAEPTPELIVNSENLGFGAAVSACAEFIERTGGAEYLLLLNNDALVPHNAVQRLLDAAWQHPEAALVFPKLETGGRIDGMRYHHRWLALNTARRLPGSFAFVGGGCLLLNTAHAPRPVFDPAFFMYGEDVALSLDVARRNKRFLHVEDVVVRHEGAASSRNGSAFYEYHVAMGHLLLIPRLTSRRSLRAVLALTRCLGLALRAALRCVRSRDVTSWVQTKAAVSDWLRNTNAGASAGQRSCSG